MGSIEVRVPATIDSLLMLASEKGIRFGTLGKVIFYQWRHGFSMEAGDDLGPLAALMFVMIDDQSIEMMGLFDARAAARMLPLVRIAQLSIAKMSEDTGAKIYCTVRPENKSGVRLASLCGFSSHKMDGNMMRYLWSNI